MHIFKKGDPDYHAALNDNFAEVDQGIAGMVSKTSNETITGVKNFTGTLQTKGAEVLNDKVYSAPFSLGFGVEGTIYRIGKMVFFSISANQSKARADMVAAIGDKVPSGFKPISTATAIAASTIGTSIQTNRYLGFAFNADGTIICQSYNMGASPITVQISGLWITNDAFPS